MLPSSCIYFFEIDLGGINEKRDTLAEVGNDSQKKNKRSETSKLKFSEDKKDRIYLPKLSSFYFTHKNCIIIDCWYRF